jgi:mannose/cellobiose epimerase-like protein (N-acyl-D-glucosamine 2-epimerase family)
MLLYEADRLKNMDLFEICAERFRRHVEVAWDDVYGGVYRSLNHVDDNLWTLDKVLWEQEEVLIGSLFVYEHTGSEWARDMFGKMYTYVRQKYLQYGSPLWKTTADRKVTPTSRFAGEAQAVLHLGALEHYHHLRHLMFNLLSIERMLGQGSRKAGPVRTFG